MGQHMSDATRDIAILTLDHAGDGPSTAIWVLVLHLYTKFEVRRPFRSKDMTHGLVTLNFVFDLETGAQYCPWSGQRPSYQFWCF